MPWPSVRTGILLALGALLATALVACGEGDDEAVEDDPVVAADASAFPEPKGTINSLRSQITPTDQVVVLPAGQVFNEGKNRLSLGVFTVDGEQITDAEVAIYAAPGPDGEARGPFPARVESLETEPEFTAQTTSEDPDAAKVVYVTDLELDTPGEWRLLAAVERDGELVGTLLPSIEVRSKDPIPDVGEKAPVIHTPTTEEVGDVSEIDTRVPPSSMHDVDFAEVVGEKPVVLLFATPALCTSRVCGPVVDVAEQVKSEVGDDVAFIHQEIWEDNNPDAGLRPQVRAYNLPTEPWLFVIDADGRVATRIEGAFSVPELEAAVDRVTG